jgi:hypothetical protein
MAALQHSTDPTWLQIIDDLLDGAQNKQAVARTTLWCEVLHYVELCARLPIGPLSEDGDARREIGDRVLKKLEANDHALLRDWRDRQRRKRDHSSWWAFIKMVTRHRAIEYARCSSLNVARRGEPFRWVRVDLVDPLAFDETASAEFLAHCTEEALYKVLDELQPSHAAVRSEPPPPPPAVEATPPPRAIEPPPPRPRRDRS